MHQDVINQIKYNYSYDSIGRLIRTDISDSINGTAVGSTEYGYNTRGHLVSVSNEIGGRAYKQYYSYSDTGVAGSLANAQDGLPTRYTALGVNTDYSYDSLNRLSMRSVGVDDSIYTLYYYKNADLRQGYTTSQISRENIDGTIYDYTYDNMGNITHIKKNDNLYRSYEYDELGQLTKEIQHDNNKTIDYVYNHLGNITYKVETSPAPNNTSGTVTKRINYYYGNDNKTGWNYLLTGYDENINGTVDENEKISYDEIGNPLRYRGAAMAWKGRQLTGHTKNGVTSSFTYDADGLRGSKTVDGVKTVYQYVGDKLYYEKRGDSQEFYYFYDSYGNLSSIYYTFNTSSANYYVTTNVQGDVTALYDSDGALVARYEYDAWGNTLSVKDANGNAITAWNHIANANPIRYRGYYYDADLGLYYLQSRYYDSQIGRFINADGYITTGQGVLSYNMFAYCGNNPVNRFDPDGEFWIEFAIVIICITTVLGGIWGAMADEPLIDIAREAATKKHEEANPANNTPNFSGNSNNSSSNNDDKIKGDSDTVCKTTPELSAADRAANIFIGATLGLAVGGAAVMLIAMPVGLSGKLKIGYKMFTLGASAFNLEAMVFAPFYAVELDPIEWEQ